MSAKQGYGLSSGTDPQCSCGVLAVGECRVSVTQRDERRER
jgi:hypothetical protein